MVNIFMYIRDKAVLERLCHTAINYLASAKFRFKIKACDKYGDALQYVKKSAKSSDIFIFDFFEWDEGHRLAAYIYENNRNAAWVMVRGSTKNLIKILPLRPAAYLEDAANLKLFTNIIEVLNRQHQTEQKKNYFNFKYEGEYIRIPYENISRFESNGKKVILHLNNTKEKYSFSAKLDTISEDLPGMFLRCHQSYLVNMQSVKCLDIKRHVFVLYSNDEVWISRRMYGEVKERYQQYINMQSRK